MTVLRSANAADLPVLLAIEQESFTEPNWTPQDFVQYPTIVAETGGQIAGVLVWRDVLPPREGLRGEREILNLAVAPAYRRQGIATLLLQHALASEMDCFLEVRESNRAAQALYRKLGFIPVGRRERYYQSPTETAIVMQMK